MKLQDIRTIAKNHNIKISGAAKADLIKKIQLQEGNFDCFGAALNDVCDQTECLWREDCIGAVRQ